MFTLAAKKTHQRASATTPRIIGQKPPLKPKDVWAIRAQLQLGGYIRDLALFNLAVDSKLRACDLVRIRVKDVTQAGRPVSRAIVMQKKTKRPVQFEITAATRESTEGWIRKKGLKAEDYLFPSRINSGSHLSTRQYARLLRSWLIEIGLDASQYGTHSLTATDQSLVDLPADQEHPSRPDTARAQQAGEYCPLSRS